MKKHFNDIDICKGLAMMGVLWNHSFILYPINIHNLSWCRHAASINSTFFIVLFFMVSGYLFLLPREVSFVENTRKRCKRLLVPYLSYSALTLIMKLLLPSLVNRDCSYLYN